MKFRKFGKALLLSALSAGVVFGITSCIQSYTVGYLYVTGIKTAATTSNGIVSGFKIEHNTGKLYPIAGLPIGSGGSNPARAVLLAGGRFLYVLNTGETASGGANCTTADPCSGGNITQFSIGGNGVLESQQTFYTQGINPERMFSDASGNFIYVLDHDAPSSTACALALGQGVTSCGDITAFKVDPTTGRLSLLLNAQVTSANGAQLSYFPVPANPIDFVLVSGDILTLSGTSATGDSVFPYTYSLSTGQLTVTQNTSQPLGISQATAIVNGNGTIYVLDNEGTLVTNGATSQILPYSLGANGALQAMTGGAVADDPAQSNPIYLIVENKNKWVYVVNQGNNTDPNNAQSGIVGYVIDPSTHQLSELAGGGFGSTVGTGAGPKCMLEDPSYQYIYTANYNDSTVTGRLIDQNSGVLTSQSGSANTAFPLDGPALWCVATGRTS
ncbi:MAG TPA: beta-propeller fold lactonase family protein [Terracidiphilus sp.]|nr:beta-propeller fold lactonase family protein [Terracidiphilus sp.]